MELPLPLMLGQTKIVSGIETVIPVEAEIEAEILAEVPARHVTAASHAVAANLAVFSVARDGFVARHHHPLRRPVSQWAAVYYEGVQGLDDFNP